MNELGPITTLRLNELALTAAVERAAKAEAELQRGLVALRYIAYGDLSHPRNPADEAHLAIEEIHRMRGAS